MPTGSGRSQANKDPSGCSSHSKWIAAFTFHILASTIYCLTKCPLCHHSFHFSSSASLNLLYIRLFDALLNLRVVLYCKHDTKYM